MANEKDREEVDFQAWWNKHSYLPRNTAQIAYSCVAEAVKAERERQAEVFRIAVNAIYFDDSSDYQSALYEIIEELKPGYAPDKMPYFETNEEALVILSDDQEARNG